MKVYTVKEKARQICEQSIDIQEAPPRYTTIPRYAYALSTYGKWQYRFRPDGQTASKRKSNVESSFVESSATRPLLPIFERNIFLHKRMVRFDVGAPDFLKTVDFRSKFRLCRPLVVVHWWPRPEAH